MKRGQFVPFVYLLRVEVSSIDMAIPRKTEKLLLIAAFLSEHDNTRFVSSFSIAFLGPYEGKRGSSMKVGSYCSSALSSDPLPFFTLVSLLLIWLTTCLGLR